MAIHGGSLARRNGGGVRDLLEEATRVSGERTYSRTVERALREMVQRAKARQILQLAGSGLWQGDLSVMREDKQVYRARRRGSR